MTFRRRHHQLIASCLQNFNSNYLAEHNILFGGGTRIALELDEYRESVDIDFLCCNKAAFRAVREQVSNVSLGDLVKEPFHYGREIRFDRYGIRTFLKVADVNIKLEFVAFDNYQLGVDNRSGLFPVPCIDKTSCFITKLLANADRVGVAPYKDIFDIIVMYAHWGEIPAAAYAEAFSHYGKPVIEQSLMQALAAMLNAPKEYALAANNMAISSDYFNSLILPSCQRMLDSLHKA